MPVSTIGRRTLRLGCLGLQGAPRRAAPESEV